MNSNFSFLLFFTLHFIFLSPIGNTSELGHVNLENWEVFKNWLPKGNTYIFEAKNKTIVEECKKEPSNYIEFPMIIQGAQTIFLDSILLGKYGHEDFQKVESYYGAPVIPCSQVSQGTEITWKAFSFNRDFANIMVGPRLSNGLPLTTFFQRL